MKLLAGKTIVLDKLPTHVACSDNKHAPNRYKKVTNQSLYNGGMNHYDRAR